MRPEEIVFLFIFRPEFGDVGVSVERVVSRTRQYPPTTPTLDGPGLLPKLLRGQVTLGDRSAFKLVGREIDAYDHDAFVELVGHLRVDDRCSSPRMTHEPREVGLHRRRADRLGDLLDLFERVEARWREMRVGESLIVRRTRVRGGALVAGMFAHEEAAGQQRPWDDTDVVVGTHIGVVPLYLAANGVVPRLGDSE